MLLHNKPSTLEPTW